MRLLIPPIVAVLSVAGMCAAATSAQRETESRTSGADGRTLYVTHCASCHGTSGRGDGPAAGSLRRRPSDLTQFERRNGGVFPAAKMHRIIDGREVGAHGSVEMPVWGDAFKRSSGQEPAVDVRIAAIVAYLESIQERLGH